MKAISRRQALKLGMGTTAALLLPPAAKAVTKPKKLPCGLKELPLPVAVFKNGEMTNISELMSDLPYELAIFTDGTTKYRFANCHYVNGECCNNRLPVEESEQIIVVGGIRHVIHCEISYAHFYRNRNVWVNPADCVVGGHGIVLCGEMELQQLLQLSRIWDYKKNGFSDSASCKINYNLLSTKNTQERRNNNRHSMIAQDGCADPVQTQLKELNFPTTIIPNFPG